MKNRMKIPKFMMLHTKLHMKQSPSVIFSIKKKNLLEKNDNT